MGYLSVIEGLTSPEGSALAGPEGEHNGGMEGVGVVKVYVQHNFSALKDTLRYTL